jgi:hypothetical protein
MTNFLSTISNSIKIVGGVAKIRIAESKVLYYSGTGDWNNLNNWWFDDQHTISASHLPRSIDSVILKTSCLTNSGNAPTVVDLTMHNNTLGIVVAVIGTASFINNSRLNGTINGSATFNNTTRNQGTVNGDVVFNNSAYNSDYVNGNATFNDTSINSYGVVEGNATFKNSSVNQGGEVYGIATFNGSSQNKGFISISAVFNDSSYNTIDGYIDGNAIFANTSYNCGTVNGSISGNPLTC